MTAKSSQKFSILNQDLNYISQLKLQVPLMITLQKLTFQKEVEIVSQNEAEIFVKRRFLDFKRGKFINIDDRNKLSFSKINTEELVEAVTNLDISSSCGVSMIPSVIIKISINILAPYLAFLFNTCIKTVQFPDEFKITIVSPPFKGKGDSSHCENNRGISVLPPIAKIFERLLSSQISKYFISKKSFSNAEHGFRSNYSCETALQMIIDDWKWLLVVKHVYFPYFSGHFSRQSILIGWRASG